MSAQAPHLIISLLLALAGLESAGFIAPNTAKVPTGKGGVAYRWVDEHGVVHYGDSIPPQYVEKERAVLNSQGVVISHTEAQKTPEQLAADARTQQELTKRRQHDSFLVTTYTSVKDIEALRDVRLDQLKGQRAAAEQYTESLRTRLATLQTRALSFQPYSSRPDARRMPDDLAENLVRTVNELNAQGHELAVKTQEETTLRAQFQADIERYRALHTIHTQ